MPQHRVNAGFAAGPFEQEHVFLVQTLRFPLVAAFEEDLDGPAPDPLPALKRQMQPMAIDMWAPTSNLFTALCPVLPPGTAFISHGACANGPKEHPAGSLAWQCPTQAR